MQDALSNWERKYFNPGGGEALLFYVVFGELDTNRPMARSQYQSNGVPIGFNVVSLSRESHPQDIDHYLDGYLWDELKRTNPPLAQQIADAPACVVIRGTVSDPPTLDYFRDTIGIVTWLLDGGGRVVYDPQMFRWWSPSEWHNLIFEPHKPQPRAHVVVLYSAEEASPQNVWVHTRGMRKFGRPDISVHDVGPGFHSAVIDLIERFIELQAFGGLISEGQEIRMRTLPPGGTVHHGGHTADPDFNNLHVEIVWPDQSLAPIEIQGKQT